MVYVVLGEKCLAKEGTDEGLERVRISGMTGPNRLIVVFDFVYE